MKRFTLLLAAVLSVAFLGCGSKGPKKPDGMPELFPCVLTLTRGGAPVDGALVTLHPASGDSQWKPAGVSDAQGVVNLATYGNFPGAPAGSYKVTVMKSEPVDSPMKSDGTSGEVDFKASDVYVDNKYAYPANTPLELEVAAGAPTEATFELD